MKKLFLLVVLTGLYSMLFSQSRVAQIDYLKEKKEGVVIDLAYAEKTISNAIQDTMKKLGFKGKDVKDFTLYKGIVLKDMGGEPLDYYFSVERKGKKEKDASLLKLLLAKESGEFIDEASEPGIVYRAKNFLDNLKNVIYSYDLEEQIKAQNDVISKNEKKMTSLIDKAGSLQKDKKKIEESIESNIKDQENQRKELDLQKAILENLLGKRRNN